MLANAGGTTSRLKGRFDSGRSRLAQADRIVVYLDRTQARMSHQHLVASTESAAVANAMRDYICNAKVAGSNPAGLMSVAQR